MIQGFYTGISGIQTHQFGIDTVADNIANISTVGYREYRSEFANLFSNALNSTSALSSVQSQIGVGSTANATTMSTKQGSPLQSERSTDLAIEGSGWFGVSSSDGVFFTRDGNFGFNSNYELVSPDGYYLLGTVGSNISGSVLTSQEENIALGEPSKQQKLQFPPELHFSVQPTTEAKFFGNLTSLDQMRVVSVKAIDSESHTNGIQVEFTRADPDDATIWNMRVYTHNNDFNQERDPLTGEIKYVPSVIYDEQFGVAKFDDNGGLISTSINSINNNGTSVKLNFGSGYSGLVANGESYSLSSTSDGKIAGELEGYSIGKNGQILASFTNGEQSSVGSVALYHFINDQALERVGSNKFMQSQNSGVPFFQKDIFGNNTASGILSSMLESSNVDLSTAMSELIVMQRSFDANAKSITTADEMIQKALQMHK